MRLMGRYALTKNGVNVTLGVPQQGLGATQQIGHLTALEIGIIFKVTKRRLSVVMQVIVEQEKYAPDLAVVVIAQMTQAMILMRLMGRYALTKNGVNVTLGVLNQGLGATQRIGQITALELGIMIQVIRSR